MEILGTGIDLVENARIAASIEKFGDRFLNRVFRPEELAYCRTMRHPTPHYAARFAAKEAVAKAFGCGISERMGFLDIEVTRNEAGAPSIVLHGPARELATEREVTKIFLSLSHTDNYSVANVILSGSTGK